MFKSRKMVKNIAKIIVAFRIAKIAKKNLQVMHFEQKLAFAGKNVP